jgi:hypothetical protein
MDERKSLEVSHTTNLPLVFLWCPSFPLYGRILGADRAMKSFSLQLRSPRSGSRIQVQLRHNENQSPAQPVFKSLECPKTLA